MKKRVLSLILTMAMVMSLVVTGVSAKNGDVIGYTRYTDIVAYINNYAIQSYNYQDYTYIVAEDLLNYGFNVEWDGTARTLNITRNGAVNTVTENNSLTATQSEQVGKIALSVLETDIRTYINGNLIPSYNINGSTIIQFDYLDSFGQVVWASDVRAIKLWVEDGLQMRPSMQKTTAQQTSEALRAMKNYVLTYSTQTETVPLLQLDQKVPVVCLDSYDSDDCKQVTNLYYDSRADVFYLSYEIYSESEYYSAITISINGDIFAPFEYEFCAYGYITYKANGKISNIGDTISLNYSYTEGADTELVGQWESTAINCLSRVVLEPNGYTAADLCVGAIQ